MHEGESNENLRVWNKLIPYWVQP